MDNLKVFRNEFKYYINYIEYESLRRRLSSVLKKDKFSNATGDYHIRSLYFDDFTNSALYEKQAGILTRRKFRIRIYNIDKSIIKLEKKSRKGQFIHKESANLTLGDYENIIAGNIDFLIRSDNSLLREFYIDLSTLRLKPNVIVDYFREAYVYDLSNIRITFDKLLRTGLNKLDLFDKELPTVDVMEEPKMILEIKYDHLLPDFIKNLLQISSQQRYAISKFVICKKYTKLNNWEDN
jgi:hypothetical protein